MSSYHCHHLTPTFKFPRYFITVTNHKGHEIPLHFIHDYFTQVDQFFSSILYEQIVGKKVVIDFMSLSHKTANIALTRQVEECREMGHTDF